MGLLSYKVRRSIKITDSAWLLKRWSYTILIPGTKSIHHLHENLKADGIALTKVVVVETLSQQ
jgi:aryl-alcohol dehydrogenase-like predicted oxidoreductase